MRNELTLDFLARYDGLNDLSTAECYNPLTNKWDEITPMGTKRSCLGICAFDGLLYVCGGYDGTMLWVINGVSLLPRMLQWKYFNHNFYLVSTSGASCLSSMERYDTLTGVWSSCPPMNTRRRYCRLAVLDHCIYSLGGYDSTTFHASVERNSHWISVILIGWFINFS